MSRLTAAQQYTRALSEKVANLDPFTRPATLEEHIQTLLAQIAADIATGEVVTLEHIGEFIKVDNHGPMIRYQADRRLLESCCIANLKQKGGI